MTNRDPIILAGEDQDEVENLLRSLGLSRYFPKYTAYEKDLMISVRQITRGLLWSMDFINLCMTT